MRFCTPGLNAATSPPGLEEEAVLVEGCELTKNWIAAGGVDGDDGLLLGASALFAEATRELTDERLLGRGQHHAQIGIVDDTEAHGLPEQAPRVGLQSEGIEEASSGSAGGELPQR